MDALTDSIRIAESFNHEWTKYDEYEKYGIRHIEEVIVKEDVYIWEGCDVPLYISIMRITGSDGSVKY